MRRRTVLAAAGLALLLAGCAGPDEAGQSGAAGETIDAAGVTVLIGPPSEAAMTALLSGELTDLDGCLGVGETVVIWPHGTVVEATDPLTIAIPGDGRARLGHSLEVGGGEISGPGESAPTDIAGLTVPASCAERAVWLAGPGSA